jgi:TolB-like protein/Tfp pilus assembly protein PilF
MPSRFRNPYAIAVAVLVLAAAAAFGVWRYSQRDSGAPTVAVLPFNDLSPGGDGSYFSDGFHNTLIAQLARIQGLTVISRTSVMSYRNGERDLGNIAKELGVAHLVEGSVQRAGKHLRVSARLVTASGKVRWSDEYDRDQEEMFSVQADIVRHIAKAIDARLTVEEEARLDQAPTQDLAAYELYLKALEVDGRSPPDRAAITEALSWLDQAIAKDPGFALAHALISRLHMTIYWVVGDYDKARLPLALEHARRAVELAPNLAESHLAMALYWYWGHREYEKALASLSDAQALEPNSRDVSFLTGFIYRRLGRWDVSISAARRAAQLDPRNARSLQVYVDVLSATGHFKEAEEVHATLAAVSPQSPLAFLMRLQNQERWTGGPGPLAPDFKRFQPKEDPYCLAELAEFDLLMLKRQFRNAAATILSCPDGSIGALHNVPAPEEQYAAIAYLFAGDSARAKASSQVARDNLKKRLQDRPDLPLSRMALAYMLAIGGDKDSAVSEADRALADMPMSKDAIVGAELRDQAAALHAYLGQHDRALSELTDTLGMVYGSYAHLVKLNPFWDSLQGDPRFKKLVGEHMPREE